MEQRDYMQDDAFKNWLKDIGFNYNDLQTEIDNDETSRLDELVRRFEKNQSELNKNNSQPLVVSEKRQEASEFMNVQETSNPEVKTMEEDYFQKWCEQEHQPPYIYENTHEASPAYGVKYYKTEADKNAGKFASQALYSDEKHVEVETPDGKTPDYEFLDALVRKAALDKQPGIVFDTEMSPEFANKLAAACLKYGMKMKGQPEKIDINEFADQLTAEQKEAISKYNESQIQPQKESYAQKEVIAQDYASHNIKTADVGKYKDGEQAEWFAAYKGSGIEPKGGAAFYSINRDIPEKARPILKEHNAVSMEQLYNQMKSHAVQWKKDNEGKPFELPEKAHDPKSQALYYAAYRAAGVEVTGMEKYSKDSKQPFMFQTDTLGFLPKEAQELISDYNYAARTKQLESARRRSEERYETAKMTPDDKLTAEQKVTIQQYEERQKALSARTKKHNGGELTDDEKQHIGAPRGAFLDKMRQQGRD